MKKLFYMLMTAAFVTSKTSQAQGTNKDYVSNDGYYTIAASDLIKTQGNPVLGNSVVLKKDGTDITWQDKGKIVITGILSDNDYNKFHIKFKDKDNKQVYLNDGVIIPDKTGKVLKIPIYTYLDQAKDYAFTISYPDTSEKNNLGSFVFAVSGPSKASTQPVTPVTQASYTDPTKDESLYIDARTMIGDPALSRNKYKYDSRFNVFRKVDNGKLTDIIIIFVDANGDLLFTPIPTTGTRDFKYEVHLFKRVVDQNNYKLVRPDGGLTDGFNIYTGGTITAGAKASSAMAPEATIEERIYPAMGPYENDFKISLNRISGSETTDLIGQNVKVAKFYYASIQVGLLATTLRSPQNITPAVTSKGDSTLTADDPTMRGLVSVMAVYYPLGRSFLFPPSGGLFSPERIGIVVGTQLNTNQFENFLGGLQFDFARGGSISFGAHYGRRTILEGYSNFKFGTDKFNGSLTNIVKQQWNVGFFFGVNIDIKILNYLFGGATSTNQ